MPFLIGEGINFRLQFIHDHTGCYDILDIIQVSSISRSLCLPVIEAQFESTIINPDRFQTWNPSKIKYPKDKLIKLAKEVKTVVDDKAKYTDWSQRADIKAELKVDLIIL